MVGLILWTVFVGGFGLIAFFVGDPRNAMNPTGLVIILIGFGPLALILFKQRKLQSKWRDYMLAEAGMAAGTGYDHCEGGEGIAINRQAKSVTLLESCSCNTYPYADVMLDRSYMDRRKKPYEPKEDAWLPLVIKHKHKFVTMRNAATRDRWVKILSQELGEV